jgi:penicillin-binding protein 2
MRTLLLSWLIFGLTFFVLIFKLITLQLFEGEKQALRAAQNRFRIVTIPAKRGNFYDRNGNLLVEQNRNERKYLLGEAGAHVLGYIGEANEEELSLFGVDMGREVGKMGLEREENGMLKGLDGGIVEENSATGKVVREFSKRQPIDGKNIQLTIDSQLTRVAYEKLKKEGFNGAVVAGTLDNRILAITSYPAFDPNEFIKLGQGDDKAMEYVESLFSDENKPLFNRAIAGIYPPASPFKIITSIAALETGKITKDTIIEDMGVIKAGGSTFSNWYFTSYGGTDGSVDLVKALQRSNDIFFYKIGEEVGMDSIANWGKKFGLGRKTGIKLEGEMEGLVPNKEWKKDNLEEDWYLGDTYITSIGQGNLQVTPIQMHGVIAAIANDGYLCQPELIGAITDSSVSKLSDERDYSKERCIKIEVKKENMDLIKKGLEGACSSGGTGWPLFSFGVSNDQLKIDGENYIEEASGSAKRVRIPVACKTGTAETGRFYEKEGKKLQKTHAWFVTYAPAKKPEIVVTVFMEDAGQGSDMAAPIAREVLKNYFENKNK